MVSIGDAICRPVSGFQRRMVPSSDPLAISRVLRGQSRHLTGALCPSHRLPIILLSLMFHNRSLPSMLPLTTIVSSGDTAIETTGPPSPSKGSPIGSPSRVHWRIEPSSDALNILQLVPMQAMLGIFLE